ncbi:MAG: periplasmic heavy metal sensor [Prolixibacteraceae bacterium]
MKAKILVSLILMTLSFALVAQTSDLLAKKQMKDTRVARMNKMEGAANQLNLTEEQKGAFKQSAIAMHKSLQPLRNELGEAEAHQRTLVTAEKPDFTAINKNIEKIGGIRVEMAKIQARRIVEMRTGLSDEQKMKFDLLHAKMKEGQRQAGMKRNLR